MTGSRSRRGRPQEHPNGSRITTAMRIDRKLLKRIKLEAVKRDVSVNLILVRALEDWLKKNEGKVKL